MNELARVVHALATGQAEIGDPLLTGLSPDARGSEGIAVPLAQASVGARRFAVTSTALHDVVQSSPRYRKSRHGQMMLPRRASDSDFDECSETVSRLLDQNLPQTRPGLPFRQELSHAH